MDRSTGLLVAAAATCVVVYVLYNSKPHHHVYPVEDSCIITFLQIRNALLNDINKMYAFLNDFAIRYGTKKSDISGTDPVLTQLQRTQSHLRAMTNVKRSQIVGYYTKMYNDIQTIIDIGGNMGGLGPSSPNVNIMFSNYPKIYAVFDQYLYDIDLRDKIHEQSKSCAH